MPKKTPRPHTPDYNDESLRAHRELMFFVWTLFAATEHSASFRTEIRVRHFEAIAMFCFNSTSGVPLIWSDNSAGDTKQHQRRWGRTVRFYIYGPLFIPRPKHSQNKTFHHCNRGCGGAQSFEPFLIYGRLFIPTRTGKKQKNKQIMLNNDSNRSKH